MKLDGTKITSIRTLKSMYDHDTVQVGTDEGSLFRLPTSTILQMVNEFVFLVEEKRIHSYLARAELKP